jgi:hypothetical protein
MNIQTILEQYTDEELLIAVGFDSAIIGVDESSMRLIYSVEKCLQILCDDMTYEDAIEHFEFNVKGA